MKKKWIVDADRFMDRHYDFENDLTARDLIIRSIEISNIDYSKFLDLVLDNHINNSGDIYGLLSVALEYLVTSHE